MRRPAPGLAAALFGLAGCVGDGGSADFELRVLAASSLTEAFAELTELFEAAHPEARLEIGFAGSQILRLQIEEGAPADVFASADPLQMEPLVQAGLVREPQLFAHNELVVIVPPDNPAGIESFTDLGRARRLVLGTREVPVGRYARRAIAAADSLLVPGFEASVLAALVSEESNARLVRAKVELGEADAAIVYRTDALATGRVRTLPLPEEVNQRTAYLIGLVGPEEGPGLARAWVEMILSAEGQALLRRHGFQVE